MAYEESRDIVLASLGEVEVNEKKSLILQVKAYMGVDNDGEDRMGPAKLVITQRIQTKAGFKFSSLARFTEEEATNLMDSMNKKNVAKAFLEAKKNLK